MKGMYGLLKFPQIADIKGYPVAEAFLQVCSGTDDASAKQLELAIKLAEKDPERNVKRGRAEHGFGGGYGRGSNRGGRGGRHGYAYGYGPLGGSWAGTDAYMYAHPPHMPAAPGCFIPPPGPGPAQVVKGLSAPTQSSAARGRCFICHEYGHFASQCPISKGVPPPGGM